MPINFVTELVLNHVMIFRLMSNCDVVWIKWATTHSDNSLHGVSKVDRQNGTDHKGNVRTGWNLSTYYFEAKIYLHLYLYLVKTCFNLFWKRNLCRLSIYYGGKYQQKQKVFICYMEFINFIISPQSPSSNQNDSELLPCILYLRNRRVNKMPHPTLKLGHSERLKAGI
jgi:hypothetical protein